MNSNIFNSIFQFKTMKQCFSILFHEQTLSDLNLLSTEEINKYNHILPISSCIYYFLYFDWFPHILVVDHYFFKKPRKEIEKIRFDISFYQNIFSDTILRCDKSNRIINSKRIIKTFNWKQYETTEFCQNCQNPEFKIKIQLDDNNVKYYCINYQPKMELCATGILKNKRYWGKKKN
jgi:hypothetical protein